MRNQPIRRDDRRRQAEYLVSAEHVCTRCGGTFPPEEFARDRSRTFGIKSWCRGCENAKSKAYYRENRERLPDEAWAKRGRPRPPELTECPECGAPMPERRRVLSARALAQRRGSSGCIRRATRGERLRRLNVGGRVGGRLVFSAGSEVESSVAA